MISILILTKNEEQDLPSCLESVSWSDDIHVFDSFSTDHTLLIAQKYGARITQRVFDGYASQRNAALSTIDFKYDWIFILDADERITAALSRNIETVLNNDDPSICGYRIKRRDFLNDRWLRYSQMSPYYIRLVRKGKARYQREVNEVIEIDGKVADMDVYIDHYPFSKGFSHWIQKHNEYSTREAEQWIKEHSENVSFSLKKAIFSRDFHEKRYHQKGIYYKFPGRPIIKWLYILFFRRGILDGKAGITYATLQSIYEYFIVLKTRELMKQGDGK